MQKILKNKCLLISNGSFARSSSRTVNTKELYRYEATLRRVARKLWQEIKNKDNMLLSGPLLQVKIEMEWEQWELDNPEVTRARYKIDKERLRSREMLENQVPWRLEWMRKNEGSF